MGAFDGLVKGCYAPSEPDYEYVKGQTAFRLTSDFTLDDLITRFRHAEHVCADVVWAPSGRNGISDLPLDFWYAKALIQHLLSKRVIDAALEQKEIGE